jgi:DNA topoisomerase IA
MDENGIGTDATIAQHIQTIQGICFLEIKFVVIITKQTRSQICNQNCS